MGALSEIFLKLKTQVDTKPIKDADKATKTLTGSLGNLIKMAGVSFGGAALVGFAKNLANTGDELSKTASQIGTTTDALQEFRHVANISGVPIMQMDKAFSTLQKSAVEIGLGMTETKQLFDSLGVSAEDSGGKLKSSEQLFLDVAAGLSRMEDPTEAAGLSLKIFGARAKSLIPVMKLGTEGIEAMRQEFRDLGGGFSEDVIEKAVEAKDNMARLSAAFLGLKSVIARLVLPAVNGLTKLITGVVGKFTALTQGVDLVQIAMITLGGVGLFAVAKGLQSITVALALAGKALKAFPVIALVLLIDDLITAFRGGESVVADFAKSFLGLDLALDVLDPIVFTFRLISGAIEVAIGAAMALGKVLGALGVSGVAALTGSESMRDTASGLIKGARSSFGQALDSAGNLGSRAFQSVQNMSEGRAATREATAAANQTIVNVNVKGSVDTEVMSEIAKTQMKKAFKRSMGD